MEDLFFIREITENDKAWICNYISREWGSTEIIARRKEYHVESMPGFIAEKNGTYAGVVTFCFEANICQIITLNTEIENIGIGTAFLKAVISKAIEKQCIKIVAITTNDNTDALRFYQARGFTIKACHCSEVENFSRKIKPEIPLCGFNNIPIRDEIELEFIISRT